MRFLAYLMPWHQGSRHPPLSLCLVDLTAVSFEDLDRKLGRDGAGAGAGEEEDEDNEFDD
jgi:hypothetical protein